MFKYVRVCAALLVLGAGSVNAEKQEAVLRHVEVAGTDFNLVIATPRSGAGTLAHLGNMPEALALHLQGGALVALFEDAESMLAYQDVLRSPAVDFHINVGGSGSLLPVTLYVVPKLRQLATKGKALDASRENLRAHTVAFDFESVQGPGCVCFGCEHSSFACGKRRSD